MKAIVDGINNLKIIFNTNLNNRELNAEIFLLFLKIKPKIEVVVMPVVRVQEINL